MAWIEGMEYKEKDCWKNSLKLNFKYFKMKGDGVIFDSVPFMWAINLRFL